MGKQTLGRTTSSSYTHRVPKPRTVRPVTFFEAKLLSARCENADCKTHPRLKYVWGVSLGKGTNEQWGIECMLEHASGPTSAGWKQEVARARRELAKYASSYDTFAGQQKVALQPFEKKSMQLVEMAGAHASNNNELIALAAWYTIRGLEEIAKEQALREIATRPIRLAGRGNIPDAGFGDPAGPSDIIDRYLRAVGSRPPRRS